MKFFNKTNHDWSGADLLLSLDYQCGYCDHKVSSERGLRITERGKQHGASVASLRICPSCGAPTFFDLRKEQYPQPVMGSAVANLPDDLEQLYNEARRCTGQGCYTAAVLICRKILMNIAVNQGASENAKFIEYIDFLAEKGFIPPNGRPWVDHIRKKGNEANHEIRLMDKDEAKELLLFSEMLLKFIYEFPSMVGDRS